MTFKSTWWSVDLPSEWSGHSEEECATFRANPARGVLQISAARKDAGIVTDDDLREFAQERVGSAIALEKAKCGTFSGFTTRYPKNGLSWQEWWLKSKHLLVYVTYNVVQESEPTERRAVAKILSSLQTA